MDWHDVHLREALARESYYRERADDAALDREHDMDEDVQYVALSWECLPDEHKRPYRSAVATCFDWLADEDAA